MTLSGLLADLYRRTGYAASPASEVVTRFTSFVNTTHRQLLTMRGLGNLRDDTTTFASVANRDTYALPACVAKIEHLGDRTNHRPLVERPLTWLRSVDPGLVSVGGPSEVYVPRGYQAAAVALTGPTQLYVKSSSASDTGVAYLEGVRTGGLPFSVSVTMTGTTAVSFGLTDIEIVAKWYLATPAVGLVSLRDTP